MTPKILVAELEIETPPVQLEKIDVHEWDIYTYPLNYEQFKLMFYSQDGDPKTFSIAPHPTLLNTIGYNQEDLQHFNWVAERKPIGNLWPYVTGSESTNLVNYFQLGGRKKNTTVQGKVGVEHYGVANNIACRFTEGETDATKWTENAYFIGDPRLKLNIKNFWAEESIIKQMESDLALSSDFWTMSSKYKIQDELNFLSWAHPTINYSKDINSLEKDMFNNNPKWNIVPSSKEEAEKCTICLLLVLIISNVHKNIKNNNLNIHFIVRTAVPTPTSNGYENAIGFYEEADKELGRNSSNYSGNSSD